MTAIAVEAGTDRLRWETAYRSAEIRSAAYTVSPQLTEVGVLNERRTTVQLRTGPRVFDVDDNPHQLIYLNWTENGTQFELSVLDIELADLLRVLRGLEPMK